MKLDRRHYHHRDDRIAFDEEPHIYYIDGKAYDLSVTGFIHSLFQEFDSEYIVERYYNKWQEEKHPKYFGMSKEDIKKCWAETGKIESEKGTLLHKDIENFYNNISVKNDSKEFGQFLAFFDVHKNLKPYRTEWEIFDEDLKLAGSIDMCFRNIKGEFILADWKRSKEIKLTNKFCRGKSPLTNLDDCNFIHYSLQLNVYKAILKKNYGINIKSMFLLRLHPNARIYQKIKVRDMRVDIKKLFAYRMKMLAKENVK